MKRLAVAFSLLAVCASSLLMAQEIPDFPKPVKEHDLLKQFAGEWETTAESVGAPGMPGMKCTGKINAKMLGGFWVVSEVETDMMGTKINAIQTIGYDEKSKKYVGTWVDSMLNHLWKLEGTLDPTGRILTLEADGPNLLEDGKTAKFRDVFEFKSKDEIATTSQMQGEDGEWITFMTGTAKRKK
jgi:hypothetical protein